MRRATKGSRHHKQGGGGGDNNQHAWFTIDLEECELLDTAWLTEKSYKTKRVHSVVCSDTKGHKWRGGAQNSMENTRRKKVQREQVDRSAHSATRQTAPEAGWGGEL